MGRPARMLWMSVRVDRLILLLIRVTILRIRIRKTILSETLGDLSHNKKEHTFYQFFPQFHENRPYYLFVKIQFMNELYKLLNSPGLGHHTHIDVRLYTHINM